MPSLSTVIVTLNSAATLPACLDSLRAHAPAASREIVVVDNASQDGTAAVVTRDWPTVQLLPMTSNLGFAAANNRGIRATTGDWLLLLNPDVVVTPGAVDHLWRRGRRRDRGNRRAAHRRRRRPRGAVGRPAHSALVRDVAKLRGRGHAHGWPLIAGVVERDTHRPQHPDWVSGACWLARRAC